MSQKMDRRNQSCGWASKEFSGVSLGDPRLNKRLIKIADRLAEMPESSINQACNGWSETKAAYRFFQNENVCERDILAMHAEQTAERAKQLEIILAIQDTSYFSYTDHKKTTGLGIISKTPGNHVKMLSATGIIMHTSFAVSTDGLPLGILDQEIVARKPLPEELRAKKKRSHNTYVAIEDKESFRWLKALKNTEGVARGAEVKVVTVCDREGDFYEFYELFHQLGASVLIRARGDRAINKNSRHSEKSDLGLWALMQSQPTLGTIEVEIPARNSKPARVATLETRVGSFTMSPPRNLLRHQTEDLPELSLNAVYVVEEHPPQGEEALEWMLVTDLSVMNFDEAVEKVRWYCLRWRIEVFHKILKSGLNVEKCRLQTADRLIRYLTVMSIVAWRIYWITLIARTNPNLPCSSLLDEDEWKVLYSKIHKTNSYPTKLPVMRDVVRWVAMLGGFLARKGDGEPGIISLWRGWKRLCDLSEGWNIAMAK
jgi:hypothetical protein